MSTIIGTIKNYWNAENTNIFNNYRDALAGSVVLVVVPALSVFFAVFVERYTFWNYTFPLLSISLAGLYDTYGRYDQGSPKNQKLMVRAIVHFVSIFFAALCIGIESKVLPYISPCLLCVCGLFLISEIYRRVKSAILISPWSI